MSTLMSLDLSQVQMISFTIVIVLLVINVFIDSFTINMIMGFIVGIGIGVTRSILDGYVLVGDDIEQITITTLITFFIVLILFVIFYKFIAPLSETTNKASRKDYEGVVGTVVTTIPKDGTGEVMLTVSLQRVSKQAKFYQGDKTEGLEEIKQGESVLIIENTDYLYVVPYTKVNF